VLSQILVHPLPDHDVIKVVHILPVDIGSLPQSNGRIRQCGHGGSENKDPLLSGLLNKAIKGSLIFRQPGGDAHDPDLLGRFQRSIVVQQSLQRVYYIPTIGEIDSEKVQIGFGHCTASLSHQHTGNRCSMIQISLNNGPNLLKMN
jgi:hypothetical protein